MPEDVSYEDIIEKDILELMGAKNMPDEQKRNLYTKMLDTIQNRVIIKITKELKDEDLNEWEKVFKEGNLDRINEFLKSKNINFEEEMFKEALSYKMEMIELAKPIKKAYEDKTKQ